jgi:hypothetical protein
MSETIQQIGRTARETVERGKKLFGDAFPSEATLNRWRSDVNKGLPNPGPPFFRAGVKTIFYRDADVDSWMMQSPVEPYLHRGVVGRPPLASPERPQADQSESQPREPSRRLRRRVRS